jgi:hypothetical protein
MEKLALNPCSYLLILPAFRAHLMAPMVVFMAAARANFNYFIHAHLIEFIATGKGFDTFFFSFTFHLRHTAIHIIWRVIGVIAFVVALVIVLRAAFVITFVVVLVAIFIITIIIAFTVLIVPLGIIHFLISHLRNSSLL